jgi:regulator of protease activity HflC (stomatin/prohibitin superfamily)
MREGSSNFGLFAKLGTGFAIALFGLSTVFGSWYTINEQERGVLTWFGEYQRVVKPGLNFKLPFVQGVTEYPVTMQELKPKEMINTYTVDNQELNAHFVVFFRIPESSVEFIYKNVPDYRERLFAMTIDRFKAEMGHFNITQVAEKRGEIRDRVKKILAEDVAETLKLEVTDFQLSNIDYTKDYRAAIDKSAVAKAEVETARQSQHAATIQAQTLEIQAKGQAAKEREQQRGVADGKLLLATAEAEAIRMRGEAEAKAIKAKTESLKGNSELVELTKAENWKGHLPQWFGGNGPVPFMQLTPPKAN